MKTSMHLKLCGLLVSGAAATSELRADFNLISLSAGTINKATPSGTISTIAQQIRGAEDLTFDTHGNLYVSSAGDKDITEVTSHGQRVQQEPTR